MMIHMHHTSITNATVMCPGRFNLLTGIASFAPNAFELTQSLVSVFEKPLDIFFVTFESIINFFRILFFANLFLILFPEPLSVLQVSWASRLYYHSKKVVINDVVEQAETDATP